jgi:hypothetical protein
MKSKRIGWMGHVARMRIMTNAYRILIEEPKGLRPIRKSRFKWKDNVRMDLNYI